MHRTRPVEKLRRNVPVMLGPDTDKRSAVNLKCCGCQPSSSLSAAQSRDYARVSPEYTRVSEARRGLPLAARNTQARRVQTRPPGPNGLEATIVASPLPRCCREGSGDETQDLPGHRFGKWGKAMEGTRSGTAPDAAESHGRVDRRGVSVDLATWTAESGGSMTCARRGYMRGRSRELESKAGDGVHTAWWYAARVGPNFLVMVGLQFF